MKGILLDSNDDLKVSVKRDSSGKITSGLVVGDTFYQNCRLVILAQKGEFKEAPTLGLGIDSYLKQAVTPQVRQKFITNLRSELTSAGLNASVTVEKNDISKFTIDKK